MAKAGDVIESPPIGDRIVFLKTARDTNGALFTLLAPLAPARGYRRYYAKYSSD